MTARARLVLWDIDGTLVDSAKLGRDAFFEAFEKVTGAAPSDMVPFAGRTDLEIAHDMLERAGFDAGDELLDRFEEALVESMGARHEEMRVRGRALPGADAALARLQREPGVVQSLLTGNVERNALVKLSAFGLAKYVDFGAGAYGSDHRVRGELVAIARRRAEERHERRFDPDHVVLVGDTPLDIAAAREGGARAVGVATGPYDTEALAAAGADAVLPDLSDTDATVREVLA
jgi:phosphoglycolate phosphatase-like HAD superfamily hydrolase